MFQFLCAADIPVPKTCLSSKYIKGAGTRQLLRTFFFPLSLFDFKNLKDKRLLFFAPNSAQRIELIKNDAEFKVRGCSTC